MKLSLGSWAFSFGPYAARPIPFELTVERMAKAGYDGIELCGFPPQITLERYATPESRRSLCSFLADHNLGISGYSADFTAVNPTTPGNRDRYLELFRRYLDLGASLGSPSLRVDSGAAPGSLDDREYRSAFHRLADLWRGASELALAAGLTVVWEFEPGFAFNKPSEILALHDLVAHPGFRLLFDTSHAYMCAVTGARQQPPRETLRGGVLELLGRLAGRIGHIHVIDSDGTLYADETSTHRPFGEGFIDFPRLVPALRAVPDIEWWCIDLCFSPRSWDLVESSLGYVRGLLRQEAIA